jgi:DNA-binding transcriptional MerR regulator
MSHGARPEPAAQGRTRGALKISALAEQTGTTAPTIRYYESVGLLPRAARQAGGQRRYDADDVRRLQFIRRCRDFGFSIEQVRALLALVADERRDCTEARDLAQAHLDAVRAKLAELRALERDIAAFVRRCDERCLGGPGSACVPLAELTRPDRATERRGVARREAARGPRVTSTGR